MWEHVNIMLHGKRDFVDMIQLMTLKQDYAGRPKVITRELKSRRVRYAMLKREEVGSGGL